MRCHILLFLLALSIATPLAADDWPQWLGARRDGYWREEGILERFPPNGPKLVWRTPMGGGYSGPAVKDGKVYVMDRIVAKDAAKPKTDFDRQTKIKGQERVLCLDAKTGAIHWTHAYDCDYSISYQNGPRCTPLVDEGRVYTLGAMGHLLCLEAATGKVIWSKDFVKDYKLEAPIWGWSAHPLLDGNKLICMVGGDGTTTIAFDKRTGKEIWKNLTAREPGYCPPMIYEVGGTRQLIIWHPEAVNGLNPETGEVYWRQPFQLQAGLAIPTPQLYAGNLLFITSFYNGPMLLELSGGPKPSAKLLWRGKSNSEQASRTDKLHAIMCTPYLQDGHIYGVCSYGQLRCLKVDSGERVWETYKATTAGRPVRWANAFLTPHEDRFFLFNEHGELIICRLSPQGYEEIDRAKLIEPTSVTAGRDYVWVHPAYAQKCIFVRNDKEMVCYSLAKE